MTKEPNKDGMEDTEDDVNTDTSKPEVRVPEEFQTKVAEILKGATKQEIDFIQDLCQEAMSDIYDKESKNKKGPVESFSTEDMPN
jgi:hypothetical protein